MNHPLEIIVNLERRRKPHRDELHGLLRFARDRNDWTIRLGKEPSGFIVCVVGRNGPRPVVAIDDRTTDAPVSVTIDNGAIGRSAGEILARRGWCNFAYVGSSEKRQQTHSQTRLKSFKGTLADKARSFTACTANDINRILPSLPFPCAVFAYNDEVAREVMTAARRLDITIPDEIAVIGVDDDELCEAVRPALSSVLPDFEGAGYEAGRLLAEFLDRRPSHRPRKMRHTYGIKRIIERLTTQDLRGGGRLVTLASAYIRENCDKAIGIADIAARLNVSKRLLQLRFSEILGHGIKDEIQQTRLIRAKELILTTNRPVGEIASSCGFSGLQPFRIAFKRQFGVPPMRYRDSMASSR